MYRVNDIFYSLQGEGFWTGTPMVFLRLSSCNLRCPFCDTDFSSFRIMTAAEIIDALRGQSEECRRVCITGGEPALQVDPPLVDALKQAGYRIHIETNGTRELPGGIDWITLSPKEDFIGPRGHVVLRKADELKLVYTGGNDPSRWAEFPAAYHFLQPCDLGESCLADGGRSTTPQAREDEALLLATDTTSAALRYALSHPEWRISLQIHKILGIS